jgi:hypothetical protein
MPQFMATSDTLTLTLTAQDLTSELKPEVQSVLQGLVPVVTSRVKARRRERLEQLVDVLTQDVKIRELDVRHAQMQARAVQAVLEHGEWLTAEQVGELGGFSKSNLAAPANRWKQERKIFALPYQGQDRFPRYALDEAYRPLPIIGPVLEALGTISPWRAAAWFESTNAWLNNRRPRECVVLEPEVVLLAAGHYRTSGTHG